MCVAVGTVIIWRWLRLGNKKASLAIRGLDNAGKSTLLHMLKHDRICQSVPTQHPHMEELTLPGISIKTYDLGGPEGAERMWRNYYPTTDAVVFLVDAADRTRFDEAADALSRLLTLDVLSDAPFLILGNKIDIPGAASEDELWHALGLQQNMTSRKDCSKDKVGVRPVRLFMCSIVKRMGYGEAFQWLRYRLK